jgi:hypothetical protein
MTRITVGDIIAEHRRSYPGRLALADGEYHMTWPELDERVNRLANALRAVGVDQGDRILWLGQNSFRVYELLGAAAKIGAMVCPGYWRWAPPEMAFAIEDFSPKVVIWQDEEIRSTVRAARAASPVAESALGLRHDGDPGHGYEAFLAGGDPADPGLDIDPDSALLVIYTAAISGRQPPRPRRRRHGLRLRADRGHRLLPVRRVRRPGRGQRGPTGSGHRDPDPRGRRPGNPARPGRRDLRPRRHRAPGLLEPRGDQRAALQRRLVAGPRTTRRWTPNSAASIPVATTWAAGDPCGRQTCAAQGPAPYRRPRFGPCH